MNKKETKTLGTENKKNLPRTQKKKPFYDYQKLNTKKKLFKLNV